MKVEIFVIIALVIVLKALMGGNCSSCQNCSVPQLSEGNEKIERAAEKIYQEIAPSTKTP